MVLSNFFVFAMRDQLFNPKLTNRVIQGKARFSIGNLSIIIQPDEALVDQ